MSGPTNDPTGNDHAAFAELVFGVGRLWRRAANQALDACGLSHSTAAPLLALQRLGGSARQGSVAEEAGLEGPSVVRIIDLLVAENLVVRAEDSSDRRARIITLTEAGEARLRSIRAIIDAMREDLVGGIDAADLHVAVEVLGRIHGRLDAPRPSVGPPRG